MQMYVEWTGDPDTDEEQSESSSDEDVDSDDDGLTDEEYAIEEIVGEKGDLRRGTKQYLCKFVGYHEPEWTQLEGMYGCEKLLSQWNRSKQRSTSK